MPVRQIAREGVFISYARSDGEAVARALSDRLAAEAPDLSVWIDRLELEGGVGWWNQIEQQLDRVEFLLLVMSPAAMLSENTRREWRAARQRGVCVYPVKGAADAALDYDALPRWMRKAHFHDPDVEWPKLLAHLRRGCRATRVPFMAPPLSPAYVPRRHESEALERLLLADDAAAAQTTLRGPGGFGKTSLAAAFCHQDRVIEAFDDGILWVTLGQSPNLLAELLKLYGALTGERPDFIDVEDAARELAQRLDGKNCLLVIDDAWSVAHVRPFGIAAGPRRLVTTRVFDVADAGAGSARIDVDRMNPDEGLQLLLARTGLLGAADAEPCRQLARRLGHWPLTLKLAGSAIRQRVARGDAPERAVRYLERSLDKHGIGAFGHGDSVDGGAGSVESTLAPSLGLLDAAAQQRYAELCVFPEDAAVPLSAVAALWQLDDLDSEDLARRLDDLALAEFDLRRGTLRLHDVLRSVLLDKLADVRAVHRQLVAVWSTRPPADAVYAWRNLGYHLHGAGLLDVLRCCLLDPEWLAAKLAATDVHALVSEFDALAGDPALRLLGGALRLSAAALSTDPRQLAPQLLTRLMARREPDLVQLLAALRVRSAGDPLLLPLHPTFDAPGGMLAMTLVGHERAVTALAFTHDGTALLSASDDGSVRSWTGDGLGLNELQVHRLGVTSLAIDRGAAIAVCGGDDGRLHVLDLARHAVVARLWDEPRRALHAVALSGDGGVAVCGGPAAELGVWDVPGRRLLRHLRGHEDRVNAVALSLDGRIAVSGSDDQTVRLWDVGSGALLHTLRGHRGPVSCVALSADGRSVLSGSTDRTLRVWDAASGACRQRLLGHEAAVTAVDLNEDATQALSGASNRMLNLWNLADGRLLRQLVAHGDVVRAVRFGRASGSAASASSDRTVKLWRLDEPADAERFESHDGAVSALAFSPDGRLCASGGTEGCIKLWDVGSGRCSATWGPPSTPLRWLAFTPDGLCVVSGNAGADYRLWFVDRAESVALLVRHLAPVDHSAFSANARYLLAACADRFVYVWDALAGSVITRIGTRRLFDHVIAPSPRRVDAESIAQHGGIAGRLGGFPVPEVEQLLDTYLPGEPVVRVAGLALSENGRFAAISAMPVQAGILRSDVPPQNAAPTASILVLDIETGALSTVVSGQSTAIDLLCVDPDGQFVAWGAPDHSIQLWQCDIVLNPRPPGGQVAAGRRRAVLSGHRDRVQAVVIASKVGLLAGCSLDKSVRVWRLDSGEPVGSLIGDSPMRTLQLSADHRLLAAGDALGRVHLLRLAASGDPTRQEPPQ